MNFKLDWKRQPKDERDVKSTRHLKVSNVALPPKFELDRKIPIYDQGGLGSCTANSGCACYRYEYAQLKGDFKFEPSRLFLYYNTREIEGTESEDSGCYIRDVFKALNKKGLCEERFFPYIESTFADKPSNDAHSNGLKYQTLKYTAVDQVEATIKQTLLSGAAVSFGFDVYDSFMYGDWKEVMSFPKMSERILGGHAVTIFGWDDSKGFLIQNSWGEDWKVGGKFYMPFKFILDSKYADDFWCIDEIAVIDGSDPVPTPTPNPSLTVLDMVKVLFTEDLLLSENKDMIRHLAALLGCPLKGSLRSKIAKQLRDFVYG